MQKRSGPSAFTSFKRAETLPEAIANSIAQAIATGSLAAGSRIVETTLAAELGVSRVPVREALKILHTQGIIGGGGHRGYHVNSFTDRMISSVQEARIALETLFLRDAIEAWRDGRADIAALDVPIEAMNRAARAGDLPEMLRADISFHTAICEASKNSLSLALWTTIARHVLIILNLARFRDIDLALVVRRHQALRDEIIALAAGNPGTDEIKDMLERHFLAARQPSPRRFAPRRSLGRAGAQRPADKGLS